MAHNNERKIYLAEQAARWRREEGDIERAEQLVEVFNAFLAEGMPPMFFPTIEAAILAKRPWLVTHCQSCDTIIDLDMRVKARPADATVLKAFRDIRCPRCNGHGRPKIVRLSAGPTPTVSRPPHMPTDPSKP